MPIIGLEGCPLADEQGGKIAEQPFERGSMFWFGEDDTIYVFTNTGIWHAFPTQQQDGQVPTPDISLPIGLDRPVSGFGRVWDTHPHIRDALGFAKQNEIGALGTRQAFDFGLMLYSENGLGDGKTFYVLYADGRYERYGS